MLQEPNSKTQKKTTHNKQIEQREKRREKKQKRYEELKGIFH